MLNCAPANLAMALARSESTAANIRNTRSGKVTVTGRLGSANLAGRPPRDFSLLDAMGVFYMNTRAIFGFHIKTVFPMDVNTKVAAEGRNPF